MVQEDRKKKNLELDQEQGYLAFLELLEKIRYHDRPRLREIACNLKQTDGEGWAVGELLESACIYLDALEY